MMRIFVIALSLFVALFLTTGADAASPLTELRDVRYVGSGALDGDSFLVEHDGQQYTVRLYFVDAPETTAASSVDARRVREQTRYFGLSDPARCLHFGQQAAAFTAQALAEPFTVHTSFASAMGRSAGGRIYGFVTTAEGKDLGSELVARGLARAHGVGRQTPDGTHRDDMAGRLRDMELAAMMKRQGIWAETDPDRLVELRDAIRAELRELSDVQEASRITIEPDNPVNINTADEATLQLLPGIGPTYAQRIVQARPYTSVEQLLRVQGLGPKRLERIRDLVAIESEE